MYKKIISGLFVTAAIAASPAFASSGAEIKPSNDTYGIDLRFPHDDEKTSALFEKANKLRPTDSCYEEKSETYPTHQETARAKAVRDTLIVNCLER